MYNSILNKDVYLKCMQVGIYDKCWWVDKLYPEVDTVIDFGCADGSLWEAIKMLCPQITKYYGVENNKEFFSILDNKLIPHYSSLESLSKDIDWSRTIMVMNSVVHEICYYRSYVKFMVFLKAIRDKGVRHIAIRDMCYNIEEYTYLDDDFYDKIMDSKYSHMFKQYLNNCDDLAGCLASQVEFFLKYTYQENWNRECEEQYLWNWDFFTHSAIGNTMYFEVDQPFRIVPQIRQIEKDFGIRFPKSLNTHRKMFLTKEK